MSVSCDFLDHTPPPYNSDALEPLNGFLLATVSLTKIFYQWTNTAMEDQPPYVDAIRDYLARQTGPMPLSLFIPTPALVNVEATAKSFVPIHDLKSLQGRVHIQCLIYTHIPMRKLHEESG